jgi:hypothetical protein
MRVRALKVVKSFGKWNTTAQSMIRVANHNGAVVRAGSAWWRSSQRRPQRWVKMMEELVVSMEGLETQSTVVSVANTVSQ